MPIQCAKVTLTYHQQPGARVFGYHLEVSDPHTREMFALVAQPSRPYSETVGLISHVTLDIRAVLLDLTDPDPF